jgi:hypothetical protein
MNAVKELSKRKKLSGFGLIVLRLYRKHKSYSRLDHVTIHNVTMYDDDTDSELYFTIEFKHVTLSLVKDRIDLDHYHGRRHLENFDTNNWMIAILNLLEGE